MKQTRKLWGRQRGLNVESEEGSSLRPREPGEDTGKVSALTPRARAPPSPGLRCVGGGQPAQPGAAARGGEARALSSLPERTAEFRGPGESVFIYVTNIS